MLYQIFSIFSQNFDGIKFPRKDNIARNVILIKIVSFGRIIVLLKRTL